MIGWTAVIFAIQSWLGETPAQAASATTPSYLQVGMAAMSLGVVSNIRAKRRFCLQTGCTVMMTDENDHLLTLIQAYMPLFLPPTMNGGASSTAPAPPVAA
jgi:hypothetical protein